MEYTFTWFIENYSYCLQKNTEALLSPEFFVRELEETDWRIRLYPRGSSPERKGYISLFLQRSNSDVTPELINIKFELSLLGKDGSAVISKDLRHTFRRGEICGHAKFLNMFELFLLHEDTLLPRDTLSVRCKLSGNEVNIPQEVVVEGSARTRIAIENVSFLHVVEDFKRFQNAKLTTWIQYSTKEICMTSGICLDDSTSDDSKLMVEISTSNTHEVLLKCNLFLIDIVGNLTKCGEEDSRTDSARKDISKFSLSLTNEYILDREDEYLLDGDLTLLCQCTFSTGVKYEKIEKTLYQIPSFLLDPINNDLMTENVFVCSSAIDEIKNLCDTTLPKDVELKTITNSFRAHKILLCARSLVFREKLTKGVGGINTEFITVHDLEDDTVESLLHFLYFDNLENLQWDSAIKLHYAANAYAIQKLKSMCSSFLLSHLNESKVGELLLLAMANKDPDLKRAVDDFRNKFIFETND